MSETLRNTAVISHCAAATPHLKNADFTIARAHETADRCLAVCHQDGGAPRALANCIGRLRPARRTTAPRQDTAIRQVHEVAHADADSANLSHDSVRHASALLGAGESAFVSRSRGTQYAWKKVRILILGTGVSRSSSTRIGPSFVLPCNATKPAPVWTQECRPQPEGIRKHWCCGRARH
jgi:hypothetical protein